MSNKKDTLCTHPSHAAYTMRVRIVYHRVYNQTTICILFVDFVVIHTTHDSHTYIYLCTLHAVLTLRNMNKSPTPPKFDEKQPHHYQTHQYSNHEKRI